MDTVLSAVPAPPCLMPVRPGSVYYSPTREHYAVVLSVSRSWAGVEVVGFYVSSVVPRTVEIATLIEAAEAGAWESLPLEAPPLYCKAARLTPAEFRSRYQSHR